MTNKFNHLNLTVKDPDSLHHIETQLNRLTTKIAHTDMVENEEARQEFFDLIMEFKEENQEHFSFETWKRIGNDLSNLLKYHENQIAQGIVEHLRHQIREGEAGNTSQSLIDQGPESMKDVRYTCHKCGNSWNSLEYLKEFNDQGLRQEENKEWKRLEKTVVHNFFRSESYPNDFEPVPQNCPVCNNGLSVEREDRTGDLEAVKVTRDREKPDYVNQLSKIAPHGWKEVDPR